MLKNKCCLYVIISIRFFSITICNLLSELPSYIRLKLNKIIIDLIEAYRNQTALVAFM
jgi:hypothetical protein